MSDQNSGGAGERLLIHIESIERELAVRAESDERLKALKSAAKFEGFDVKTIMKIVRERRLSPMEVCEEQALLDTYRAALGMLDGTPLGDAARARLDRKHGGRGDGDQGDGTSPEANGGRDKSDAKADGLAPATTAAGGPLSEDDMAKARERGAEAGRAGARIISPYVAGDPRRAAWDEGWCQACGSDGMDVPDSWRRSKKRKSNDPGGDPEPGSAAGAGEPKAPTAPGAGPNGGLGR